MTSARPTFSRHLRNLFLGGLVVVVPIVLTVNALVWLFRFVDGLAGPLTEAVLGRPVPGIGFVTTVAVVFLAGFLFSFGPLKKLLVGAEQLLDAVPVVGVVYGTTKKVLLGDRRAGLGERLQALRARAAAGADDAGLPDRHLHPEAEGRAASTRCAPSTCPPTTSTWATWSCCPCRT